MKKMIVLMSVLGMVLMSGCQTIEVEKEDELIKESLLADIFKHEYSESLFLFGSIMKSLAEIETEEDLVQTLGMIELYLTQNHLFIFSVTNTVDFMGKKLVDDIYSMMKNQKKYIEKIQPLLTKENLAGIKSKKSEFTSIYQLERDLNDQRYIDPNGASEYLETLRKMNQLLTE